MRLCVECPWCQFLLWNGCLYVALVLLLCAGVIIPDSWELFVPVTSVYFSSCTIPFLHFLLGCCNQKSQIHSTHTELAINSTPQLYWRRSLAEVIPVTICDVRPVFFHFPDSARSEQVHTKGSLPNEWKPMMANDPGVEPGVPSPPGPLTR